MNALSTTPVMPEIEAHAERSRRTIEFGSPEAKEQFRSSRSSWLDGRLYALSVFLLLTTAIGGLAVLIPEYKSYFVYLFPAYFLFFNLIEYVLHRFPMHHKTRGFEVVYEHVTIHHNFYADDLFYFERPVDYYAAILPAYLLIGLSAVIFAVAGLIYLVSDSSNALFFAALGYTYYLSYEVLHFSYHTSENSWVKKIPLVRSLSRQHVLHHQTSLMTHCNFNITFPIFDVVFNTRHRGDAHCHELQPGHQD